MTRETREWIQGEARRLGLKVKDLIAMSPGRDPLYVGSEMDYAKARWFRAMWDEYGRPGLHLRGLHYIVQQVGGIERPDGQAYVNTDACWSYLKDAFGLARKLREVGYGVVRDKRSPPGEIWADSSLEYDPEAVDVELWTGVDGVEYAPEINWDSVGDFASRRGRQVADEVLAAVFYDVRRFQPFYLSVWSEKDFDEIREVCEGVANYVPNIGQASDEHVNKDLERIREFGKPAVIFYLSDFDPKGMDMPISVSRHFETFADEGMPRIRLVRLAITPEQVVEHQIPRSPIKRGKPATTGAGARAYDAIRDVFQATFGEGAVELDAVVGLYPEVLRGWVGEALRPWVDRDLQSRVDEVIGEARREIGRRVRDDILAREDELEELRSTLAGKIGRLAEVHEETVEELELQADVDALRELLDAIDPDLGLDLEFPDGQADGEEREWLLDTDRGYAEQLRAYKGYDMRYQ